MVNYVSQPPKFFAYGIRINLLGLGNIHRFKFAVCVVAPDADIYIVFIKKKDKLSFARMICFIKHFKHTILRYPIGEFRKIYGRFVRRGNSLSFQFIYMCANSFLIPPRITCIDHMLGNESYITFLSVG